MSITHMVDPHGGKLVNCIREGLQDDDTLVSARLTQRQQCDLEMLAVGALIAGVGSLVAISRHLTERENAGPE